MQAAQLGYYGEMNTTYLLLLVLGLMASCQKTSVPPAVTTSSGAPVVDFARSFSITPSYDQKSATLRVLIKLVPGVHAYGQGEKIGRPVALQISSAGNWVVVHGPMVPDGHLRKLGSQGTSVVLDGEFTIEATVKHGFGPVVGVLHLQVCSDTACDRPREHIISVDATGK